ncbi:hypothetical protein D1007_23760 [Hordeum vulgare]|nr:hypothetical protein D1007_23760 [Hordeum vulgare]
MERLVNVHYMNKEAFLSNNVDTGEETIVFGISPSYDEVVAEVRHILEWMDPNDVVKLIVRYDVGVGVKSRLKSMSVTSDLHWDVYMEKVAQTEDKLLELFATKVGPPRFAIDLDRRVSYPITKRTSVPLVEYRIVIDASNAYRKPHFKPPSSQENEVELYAPNACSQQPTSQANEVDVIASEKVIQEDGDGDADADLDELEGRISWY